MAFAYEVGKTYLDADGNDITIELRNPEYHGGPLVYGRTADGFGTWYFECTGIDFHCRRATLSRSLVLPPPPLVFEEGKCYVDGAGTTIHILLVRKAADEMVGEVVGEPACPVRRYRLNGKNRGSFEHLVAVVPAVETAMPQTELGFKLNIVMSHGSFRLTPLPSMTPYQSLLLCNLLLAKSEDRWLGASQLDRIYKATKEHWTSAMSCSASCQ